MLGRLNHVALAVPDLAAASALYRGTLGARVSEPQALPEHGVTIVFVTHDIDESVYLGERVVVLSASPTTVMQDVPIDLGSVRSQLETRADPRFGQLRGQIYALIKDAKHQV